MADLNINTCMIYDNFAISFKKASEDDWRKIK